MSARQRRNYYDLAAYFWPWHEYAHQDPHDLQSRPVFMRDFYRLCKAFIPAVFDLFNHPDRFRTHVWVIEIEYVAMVDGLGLYHLKKTYAQPKSEITYDGPTLYTYGQDKEAKVSIDPPLDDLRAAGTQFAPVLLRETSTRVSYFDERDHDCRDADQNAAAFAGA